MTSAARQLSSSRAEAIRESFYSTGDPAPVLKARTSLVDEIVREAWESHLAPVYDKGLALVAVGGYGRRELFPHSDIDLLLLVDRTPDSPACKEAISVFIRGLWDCGLRLSHSVHTPSECCEVHDNNIELNISLLDERLIAGDTNVYSRLAATLPRFLQTRRQDMIRHLCQLARNRHAKFHGTIQHLEPNIKETPGGLRDLHMVWWLGKLRGAGDEAMAELGEARGFLHALRCYLHFQAGRDQNLLSFDAQEDAAELKFAGMEDGAGNPAAWMRGYFRHARRIHRSCLRGMEISEGPGGSLLRQFVDWRSRLSNADFTVSRERVFLKSPHQLDQDPDIVLRLIQFTGRHAIRLAADTESRIQQSLPIIRGHFAASRPLWPAIRDAFSAPNTAIALQAAHEAGLLTAIFPEWSGIDCLVVRDFYHRYTVDEHTLVAIDNLLQLRSPQQPTLKRFANVMAEIDQPELLVFALLFHDAGKGQGAESHSAESARLAAEALARIQAPAGAREMITFLIDHHLDLSAVMNARDLDDPSTARDLAQRVGTLERLKYLTLITYADISAVNPTAMNPWRLEQLWRVYLAAFHELTRELESERIHHPASETPEKAAFLEGFPTRYLRTHTPAEVEAHFRLSERSTQLGVAMDIDRLDGVYRLTIITADRPFLFASLAGALSSFGQNILRAEAFANARGQVLDTFVFADPGRTLELNPQEIDRLRVTLERVALGKVEVRQLLQSRPKPAPPSRKARIQPRVSFDSDASNLATLVEVIAEDRPGLLHELAAAFSSAGCNIEVVLIDTEAHKALDVFYVTAGGAKLTSTQQQVLEKKLLAVSGA